MKEVSFRNDVLPLKNVLFRLALRITTNREEAEDVVQETLMRVWDKRAEWDAIDSMEAFALSVCRNLSIDFTKRKGRHDASLADAGVSPPTAPTSTILSSRRTKATASASSGRSSTPCRRSNAPVSSCATSRGKATRKWPR